MKKLLFLLFLLASFRAFSQCSTDTLVVYDATTSGALVCVHSNVSASANVSLVSPATTATGCSSGVHCTGITNTTTTQNTATDGGVEFTLTAASGYTIAATMIKADGRRSSTGPLSCYFAYSTDGGSTWTTSTNQANGGTTCSVFATRFFNISMSSVSSIKFRIYELNAASSTQTFTIRNIRVTGTVTAPSGPTPEQKAAFFPFFNY